MSEKQIREFYDKDFLTIMREIKKKSEVNKTFNLGKKNIIKVALLGTGSLQYFASILKYGLNMVDVSIEVFIGTYKGAEIDIMDDDSEYYKFEPDITVIFTDYREILQFPDLLHNSAPIAFRSAARLGSITNVYISLPSRRRVFTK